MITDEFLAMLRCPENRARLVRGDWALVADLNREITAGRLRNRGGQPVTRKIDGLLVRDDSRLGYPIVDEIPILLVDEAVELTGFASKALQDPSPLEGRGRERGESGE
jgi:uncharacterized protein YbaR (Trm112 family)